MIEKEKIHAEVERHVLGFLEKGREGWDIPHTRAVVYYAEELAKAAGLDVLVFVTAALFHDVGYYGLFKDTDLSQYVNVRDKKALHMLVGARMAREFLERPEIIEYYSPEQIEQIVHLVGVHDDLGALSTVEELVFMEADTLGAIDLSRVIPTFDKDNGLKYIESLKTRRLSRFISDLGKQYATALLPAFEEYFEQM